MEIKKEYKKAAAILGAVGLSCASAFGLFNLARKSTLSMAHPKALKKREELLRAQAGDRLMCVKCKYCKKRIYSPFFSRPVQHWVPLYCKKFKFTLNGDIHLRCGAMLPEDAQREGTLS